MPPETLTAAAAAGSVLLRWTNPAKAVSGRPAGPLEAVEIWVFDRKLPAGGRPLTSDEVEKTARLVRRIPRREFGTSAQRTGGDSGAMAFTYALDPAAAAHEKLAFTVRVFDRHGRASDFSAPVTVELVRKDEGSGRGTVASASPTNGGKA
jgi:hypothetical protein